MSEMATSISQPLDSAQDMTGFVAGRSPVMQELNATVGELARTDMPVLLHGESGTGKEVYGRLVHRLSARGSRPLGKLGCTIIKPIELLTAVHQASQDAERHETLLLDNVDELDLDCQRALLSLLQENETRGEGQNTLRLISTATQDLDREIEAGRFRRELYYRMAGAKIRLPALRERKEDVPEFVEYFLERHSRHMGRKAPAVNEPEMEILQSYEWPGNIRELENLCRKIAALGMTRQLITDMSGGWTGVAVRTSGMSGRISLKAVAREASRMAERDLILKALEKTHWNRKQAAKQLQISYKALLYKIKQMKMPGEMKSGGEQR